MTHDELIKRGADWLCSQGCSIVVTNLVANSVEKPDAIGWHGVFSILIEAKVSLSDFMADHQKIFRRYPESGMGCHRYYIIPNELEDKILPRLPDKWGLLIYGKKRAVIRKRAELFYDHDKTSEIGQLISIIRRIGQTKIEGVAIKVYTIDNKTKSELFIDPERI